MIRALTAAAACLALASLSAHAARQAPPSPAASDPGARAAARIKALHQEAEALARQERTLLGDLRRLEVERDLRVEESRRLDGEAAALEARMADTRREIETLRVEIDAVRPSLERRLVEVYKLGRPGYGRLLLGARNVRDAGRVVRQTVALAAMDQRRVDDLRASMDRLDKAGTDLRQQAASLQKVQESARVAAADAQRAAEARAALIRQIDSRRDLAAQMAGELELASQRLRQVVPGDAAVMASLPIKPFRGGLDWPARGRVLSWYGQRRNPRFGVGGRQTGIEIAAAEGAPVRAVHEGRVVFADVFTGLGQLVILDHGGLAYTLYGHLGSVAVQKGAHVDHGQAVGTVGPSPAGNSALYFELRIDGRPVDPLEWLKDW
jgi:septal ring factor EnvC (AmiA/AmiB activator)